MTHFVSQAVAACIAAAAVGAAGTAFADGASVVVHDAVARVQVIPEARGDVSVTVTPGRKALPSVRVWREGDRTMIDGGLAHRIHGCGSASFGFGALFHGHRDGEPDRERGQANVAGLGRVGPEDMPLIVIRTPLDARVAADGAVFGQVAGARSLDLAVSGCGDWRTGDVAGPMGVHVSGSGDVTGGRVGALRAALSGSGDLKLGRVDGAADISTSGSADVRLGATGPLDIRVGGSSDIHVDEVQGPVRTQISGSGNVTIDRGRSPDLRVAVAGSGDFRFHGEGGAVSASVAGSGDILIDHATGPVSQSKAGSGDIHIGR